MNHDRRVVLATFGAGAASLVLYRQGGAAVGPDDGEIERRVQTRYTSDLIIERRQADDREIRIIGDYNQRIAASARSEKQLKEQIVQLEARNAQLTAQHESDQSRHPADEAISQLSQQLTAVKITKGEAYAQLQSVVDEVAERAMPGQVAADLAFIRNVVANATPIQREDLSNYADDNFYIFYAFDEYDLSPEALLVIQAAAAHVRDVQLLLPAATVAVIGHAEAGNVNESSGEAFLMRLAERQAKSVADALVSAGVPISSLSVDWNATAGQARQEDGYPQRRYTHIVVMRGA